MKKKKYAGGGTVGAGQQIPDYNQLVQQLYGTVGGEQAAKDLMRRGMSTIPSPGRAHAPTVKKPMGATPANKLRCGGAVKKRRK